MDFVVLQNELHFLLVGQPVHDNHVRICATELFECELLTVSAEYLHLLIHNDRIILPVCFHTLGDSLYLFLRVNVWIVGELFKFRNLYGLSFLCYF